MKKGQKANTSNTYNAIHLWLHWNFGHGEKCENCRIEGKKNGRKWSIEWALRPGFKYERKKENFIPLCMSCHRKQDMNEEMKRNMREGWVIRKQVHGLLPTDKYGRFIKTIKNPA